LAACIDNNIDLAIIIEILGSTVIESLEYFVNPKTVLYSIFAHVA